ncbi:MAG: hypothetical protein AAF664_09910 [Planctomycetota bacterium]
MSSAQIDRTIVYGLLAFVACGVCWLFDLAVSALMLGGLGAMSGCFAEWRTERGLWMLGALFLLVFGGFSLLITYHQIADWFAGRAPLRGLLAVDWFIGTTTLTYMVRFLWAVTYWNGRVSPNA